MASIGQLLKGGSFTPLPGGNWSFDVKIKSKFKWDTKKLKRKIGESNAKALKKAGGDVRSATKKAMSFRSPLGSKSQTAAQKVKSMKKWTIATRGGSSSTAAVRRDSKGRFLSGSAKRQAEGSMLLVALIDKVPRPDVVTSWRTPRFPKGFLREDIEYDYDYGRQSVAIGPTKSPKVNRLLEFGGTTTHYFMPFSKQPPGTRRDRTVVYGRLTNRRPTVRGTRIFQSGVYSFTRSVRGRGYMEKGLAKALPKIPEKYRNTITGP